MERKLFLIDGHSLIFRMYYAFFRHPMINSKGMDVSILFGFMKYILELADKEHPSHIAVCFDPPGKTFRHEMYPEYKGTRQATPELVKEALDPLCELCAALDIPVLMVPGFEGDDVLGSMAVRTAAQGVDVYMVTPDKDFGQLIGPHIRQLRPGTKGADNEILGPAEICAKLGIDSPSQVVDMLTICGDTSDNVPGVNGIGETGASRLLKKYGSVQGIYDHLDELTASQRAKFEAARDHIDLSRTLVTIKTDIPLDTTLADMELSAVHSVRAIELFNHYEFSSLKKYIHLADGQSAAETVTEHRKIEWTAVDAATVVSKACASGKAAIIVEPEGDGLFAGIRNITAACESGGVFYVSEGGVEDFSAMLSDSNVLKCGYDLKLALNLLRNCGVELCGVLDDIELMHYLVNPEKSHKVEMLGRSYLNVNMEDEVREETEQPSLGLFDIVEDEQSRPKTRFKEAVVILLLDSAVMDELVSLHSGDLYHKMEEPLLRVLADMERAGVKVDLSQLREYAKELSSELQQIEAGIREMTGEPELNVSSPKQVGNVLFEKLRIDPRMKPKKDVRYTYPTDEETLMNYAEKYPVINEILEYRAVRKLLNTYIEPFGEWISPYDGRIHTSFNQALTATGRLSSSRPNLQNIPIRTDRGREIRKAFVASSPDRVLVSADYSQIELRLMAHFSGDENMIHAFRTGRDVHATTAARIFGVPLEEVTDSMRRTAKTANFGIIYGISAFGLAQRLRIPRVAAKKIIEDYFAGFPTIQAWIERTKADALQNGYVQTLFGRRRYLPDIASRNATVRAFAERNAVNAPIQGTAADIIKMAMINVAARIKSEALESSMVLQIHDELVFEAPRTEVERLVSIIKEEMENVISLSVPLVVECDYGENWLEAH